MAGAVKRSRVDRKHKKFLLEYLKDFNGTQAAIRAGYSKRSAAETASEILRKSNIAEALQAELSNMGMVANEILGRLTLQARADISEFVEFGSEPVIDKTGTHVGDRQVIHVKVDAFKQYGHLVKSVSPAHGGGFRVEMYSAQEALELLGKAQRLFVEQFDVRRTLRVGDVEALMDVVYGKAGT